MRRLASLVAGIWLIGLVAPVSGAEPSPTQAPPGTGIPNLLDRAVIDALVLADGESGEAATLLVVLPPAPDGTIQIELLGDEPGGWQTLARTTVELPQVDSRSTPFLVGGGKEDPLVLVAPSPGRTTLSSLEVGDASLGLLGTAEVAGWFIGAGPADVDGDGTTELVVASQNRSASAGPLCATRLEVRDPGPLSVRSTAMVMATIGAASLGRFDGRPGDDLASIVAAACGDAPDRAERGDLVAARLSDGATIPMAAGDIIPAPIVDQDPTTFLDPSVPPVPVYLDPLGRGSITGIDGGSYPLAVASAGDRAAWLVSLDTSPGAGVHVRPTDLVVQKVRAGSDPVRIIDLELRPNLEAWSDAHVGDGYRSQGPAGFIGDVDADGCPELVAPLLTIPCATSPDALPQAGPSWIGTRPFGVVEGRQRRLLVAASLEWLVPGGGLLPPSPVGALAALGGWRTTGSVPFAIGELRAQDLLYFPRFPVPSPTFDPATGRERPEAVVAGRAGERILARIEAIDPAMVEAAAVDISLAEFLETGLGPGTLEPVFQRTAVRPGGLSGVDDLAHRIPLLSPDATSEASAWRVTAVTVNDWGEISGPVQGSILVDVVGPALVLEPPSASLPWPLTATLQGTTESRATIEVVGGPTVTADRRGRYEVALSLAPWPQDITLHATDDNGNRTTRTVSVMAGLDVRQLPWQGFIVLGVFGAVAYAVVRDGRRATPASLATHRWTTIDRRGLAVDFDADEASPGATIEELDPVPRT